MKTYLVGGAVRDIILERAVKDRDFVVVDATPQEMIADGFKRVGADFPVFLHPTSREEYALARVERKTGNGYLGFEVDTDGVTIEEDLARRDLTINSMARRYHERWEVDGSSYGELVDPHGGLEDLNNKILRHTSSAFEEDPLRVVRLARFAARYSEFSIAPETEALAIKMIADGQLNHIPYERYWAEMSKVFYDDTGCPARFFKLLFDWKVLENVKFFNDVFGGPEHQAKHSQPYRNFISRNAVTVRKHVDPYLRMTAFIAITAREDLRPINGVTADLMKLHSNLWAMRKVGDTTAVRERVDATFALMKIAKPWGEGPHYNNLLTATRVIEMNGIPSLCSHRLELLRDAINEVKAEQFPNLEGKELGAAIEAARKKAVEQQL